MPAGRVPGPGHGELHPLYGEQDLALWGEQLPDCDGWRVGSRGPTGARDPSQVDSSAHLVHSLFRSTPRVSSILLVVPLPCSRSQSSTYVECVLAACDWTATQWIG